jgi:hypothetical protein
MNSRNVAVSAVAAAAFFVLINATPADRTPPPPTFSREIVRIFAARCQQCHHVGGPSHLSLESYEPAKALASEIAQLTRKLQMPPWKPVAGCGSFAGERRLTQFEIDTIGAWVAAGAPEGDRAQLPPRRKFDAGWKLGKPDLVVEMPEPYSPPGDHETFRSIVIPLDFPETRYVTSVDVRPSSPRTVHHVTAMIDSSGKARKLDAADPKPGYDGQLDVQFIPTSYFGNWFSNAEPFSVPEGVGIPIPPHSDLVLYFHFHPRTATPPPERAKVAFYFAKKRPRRLLEYRAVALGALEIPAGNSDVRVTASYTIPKPIHMYALGGHMHYLGHRIEVNATRPGGVRECLLKIDDWDPAWGGMYQLAAPLALPAGTVIDLAASFDNTAANPRNPSNPPVDVHFGQTTKDEMCFTEFTYTTDESSLP